MFIIFNISNKDFVLTHFQHCRIKNTNKIIEFVEFFFFLFQFDNEGDDFCGFGDESGNKD
jgi:hypothetical protein